MSNRALTYRFEPGPGGGTVVHLAGEMDEHSDFATLLTELRGKPGPIVLELAKVRRINSCGVRDWIQFVQRIPEQSGGRVQVVLEAVSPALVAQLNMIENFRGPARVRSFLAPYVCEACGAEEEKLLTVAGDFAQRGPDSEPPSFPCGSCGKTLTFDELPERYFAFLIDEGKQG